MSVALIWSQEMVDDVGDEEEDELLPGENFEPIPIGLFVP